MTQIINQRPLSKYASEKLSRPHLKFEKISNMGPQQHHGRPSPKMDVFLPQNGRFWDCLKIRNSKENKQFYEFICNLHHK